MSQLHDPIQHPSSTKAVNTILSSLHTASSSPRPKLSTTTITSVITHLSAPTLPAPTLSALLTALCQLPPSLLSSHSTTLGIAISNSVHRASPVLTTIDFIHAARLLTLLSAISDTSATTLRTRGAHVQLLHSAASSALLDTQLREALRRMSIISGISSSLFHSILAPSRGLRTRAGLLVAAAAANRKPVRILALDGGGTRAVLSLQILKKIEALTGKPISQTFDLIAGTSTGGVLAVAVGLLRMSLQQCEDLYFRLAKDVFDRRRQNPAGIYGAGRLLLNKGVYSSKSLKSIFDKYCGEKRVCDVAAGAGVPRVFVVSTQIAGNEDRRTPRPFLHANYGLPSHAENNALPRYAHGSLHKISEALRATTAAPVYFDAFTDDHGQVFCDGGVLVNNPTAVAVHEARQLWPGREIGVVVSVGTGLFTSNQLNQVAKNVVKNGRNEKMLLGSELAISQDKILGGEGKGNDVNRKNGKMKQNVVKEQTKLRNSTTGVRQTMLRVAQAVLDSATDTESVHHAIEDLIENPDLYYRLNPTIGGEDVLLDEFRPKILTNLKAVGRAYCAEGGEGEKKIRKLCSKLGQLRYTPPGYSLWRNQKDSLHARL